MNALDEITFVEDVVKTLPQIEIETRHHFAGGIYEREIFVKAGTIITGKIHKTCHLAKLVSGTMRIYSADDQATFTGPHTFRSLPGVKRLGLAETDCVFSTFHIMAEKSIEEIEKDLVVDTIDEYNEHLKSLEMIGENKRIA